MADSLQHYYFQDGGNFTKIYTFNMANILLILHFQDGGGWESKHGGLLGIKYILAVRPDLASILLPRVYPAVQTCKILLKTG